MPTGTGQNPAFGWNARTLWDLGKFFILGALLIWLLVVGSTSMGYNWQWYRVPRYIFSYESGSLTAGPLIDGLLVTLQITGVGLVLAFAMGLTAALFRLSDSFLARLLARGYLEVIRNTPLLIQLFFMYFVLSPILDIGAFTSAVVALSLFEGAYASEIIRSGIESITKGQWEAAHSLGLGGFHTYTRVILPQAFRKVLPPLTGQAISLIKDSALVSTIAIYDLTMRGQEIIAQTFLTFEIWFTVAGIYLVLTLALSFLVDRLAKRLAVQW